MTTIHRFGFLTEFLRAPDIVAAVTPSSAALAAAVTVPVPLDGAPVVLELGPGTGAFTAAIQRRLSGRGQHLAIEINERFAAATATGFPAVHVIVGDASNLREVLTGNGFGHADIIVSGLPWAAFAPERQDDLLAAIASGLAADGVFSTFAYSSTRWMPSARRLRRRLADHFEEVLACRTVWANLPPAFVYHCRRPRLHSRGGHSDFATRVKSTVAQTHATAGAR
ncbi:class I SAM-dependent methyltransferase [Nocardia sp. NPDC059091]|uniref:class I SAM-dependent methyltransferase n=1 Tax=unclassified Nocardia TaxID=2637762 RepID=UPI0036760AAF